MSETHGFVRVPPDSTGKRITHSVMVEITVNGVTDQAAFLVGEAISFGTSPLVGYLSEVGWLSGSSAELHISLRDPIVPSAVISVGENMLINGVVKAAVLTVGEFFYFQQNVLVGGKNNVHSLEINKDGAALTAYAGGTPEFDAYGRMQVSEQHTVANYVHTYDTLDNLFTTTLAGDGAVTHLPNTSGVKISVGTASGAKVVRTSDMYHVYQPGVSQILTFTGATGDNGADKGNTIRRAGLYDDDNGVYFELVGSTFNVVLRSKSTGVVVETRIPSTLWNHDRLDGQGGAFNPSGLALNPTKDNIFWIDYQWFGAGSVRFGMYINGKRTIVHSMDHTGNITQSYMTSGSLPFRYEIENTGVSISSSEMTIFCASVKSEGTFNPRKTLATATGSASVTTTSFVPVMSIRPKQTFNSINNRGSMYMYSVMLYNAGSDPMLVQINRGSVTTGGTWNSVDTTSIAEANITPTGVTGTIAQWSIILPPNKDIFVKIGAFDEMRQGFRRKADITAAVEQVVTAKLLSGSTGGTLHAVLAWDEVRS